MTRFDGQRSYAARAAAPRSTPNPLLNGFAIPSAALVEHVVGATSFELSPGLAGRSSCPEMFWQAAKRWHEYYEKERLEGARCVGHVIK